MIEPVSHSLAHAERAPRRARVCVFMRSYANGLRRGCERRETKRRLGLLTTERGERQREAENLWLSVSNGANG
jgi:hypothetical protein